MTLLRKKHLAWLAGFGLLAGAALTHADTDTGLIQLQSFPCGLGADVYGVMMKTPSPTGMGRR